MSCGHEGLLDTLGQEARLLIQLLASNDISQWLALPRKKDPCLGVTALGIPFPSTSLLSAYNKFGLNSIPQLDEKKVITTTILLSLMEKAGFAKDVGRLAWVVADLLDSLPCNHHGLGEMLIEKTGGDEIIGEVRPFGSALYTTLSLLNHSCLPNLARVNFDGWWVAAVATRQVAKGEEFTDCYGLSYQAEEETETRRNILQHRHGYFIVLVNVYKLYFNPCNIFRQNFDFLLRYGFVCTCSACNSQPVLKENVGSDVLKPSESKVEMMRGHLAQLRTLWQRDGNKVFEM